MTRSASARTGFAAARPEPTKTKREFPFELLVPLSFLLLGAVTSGWPEVADVFGWPLSTSAVRLWLLEKLPALGSAAPYVDLFLRGVPFALMILVGLVLGGEVVEDSRLLNIGAFFATLFFFGPVIAAGVATFAYLTSYWISRLFHGTGVAAVAVGHGFSTAGTWAGDHVGLLIGIVAAAIALAIVVLGWILHPAERRENRPDVVTGFFQTVFWTGVVFALPAYGAYLFEHYGRNSGVWFKAGLSWCWGWYWWDRTTSDQVWNVVVVIFGTIFSLIASVVFLLWVAFSACFWIAFKIFILLCLGWWKLANVSPTGAVVSFLIAAGILIAAHFTSKELFGANPIFVLLRRAGVKFGHLSDASVLMLSREKERPTQSEQERPVTNRRFGKDSESPESDPSLDVEVLRDPEVQQATDQVKPYLTKVHDAFPELGRIPNLPTDFRGYLDAAKERARLRSREKSDRLKVDLLKTVNEGLDQVSRYEETVEKILRNRDRRGIRDLEDKVAKRKLEIELKQLDVQDAQLSTQLTGATQKPRQRRESEDFAREIFEKQASLSEVDAAVKKLIGDHPDQEEDIRAMAEHYRQRILTKGR